MIRAAYWRLGDYLLRVAKMSQFGPLDGVSDDEHARHAGKIPAVFEAKGRPIAPYDLLIAGQALRHGPTRVTANTWEFARVPGLKWEDWGTG